MIPTKRKNSGKSAKTLELKKIAELVGGEIVGDSDISISGVAGIKEARKGEITFLANSKYLSFLDETEASAVITSKDVVSKRKSLIRTSNPSQAFTKVIALFASSNHSGISGIHPTSVIDPSVVLGKEVAIGPHVVIEKDCSIGNKTVIQANSFIGSGSTIGSDTLIYPNVTVRERTEIGDRVIIHSGTVIGSDGYGYESVDEIHVKIPHTGMVRIEDDVEIGANVCVDRGRFDATWIKKGTKIDNLVQIAHNVIIGENCLIVSQAGISGSTKLGKNVVLAGQAGLVGHIELGDCVVVGAGAGVTKSIPANSVVLGQPARPLSEQKRIIALTAKLPEIFKELSEIKRKLSAMSGAK